MVFHEISGSRIIISIYVLERLPTDCLQNYVHIDIAFFKVEQFLMAKIEVGFIKRLLNKLCSY